MYACVSEPCLPVRTWDSPLQLLPLLALPCSPDRGERVGGRVLVFPRPVCLRAGKRTRAASQGIARINNTAPRVGRRPRGPRKKPPEKDPTLADRPTPWRPPPTTVTLRRYDDTLVVPIIENTPEEKDLKERMARAMEKYPDSCAVLVRRHGVYVWGETWEKAKTMCECYDYLFDIAVQMKQHGLDPSKHPAGENGIL
ncbi:methylthioribulose-1-phosphate dehydratase isoform X2 [Patagioenas fasciata]|uniref:methylthioribulose-1-phosphate dehydratase isoform X2 n=1 Tax=Patagioenas fasciata TaxID=372321 RepID=UPI003A990F5C